MKPRWALALGTGLFCLGLIIGSARMLPTAQLGRMKDRVAGGSSGAAAQGAVALGQADRLLTGKADVAMVGDSITQFGRWNEMFPDVLIANRGIAGDTVAGLLQRVEVIRAVRAERTFLMIGINDILAGRQVDTITKDYEKLVISLKPDTQLFIQTTLPCGSFRCDRWILKTVAALNKKLAAIAKRHGVSFIDVAAQLTPDGVLPSALSDDGVHLNAEAYRKWQAVLAPHVKKAAKNTAQNSTKRL